MSRKPIEMELRGLRTPRERMWEAMLKVSENSASFDKTKVQDHCEPMVSWTAVDDYFDALEAAGFLKRVGGTSPAKGVMGTPIQFKLVKRQGDAPRLCREGRVVTQGGGNAAMWQAMKVLSVFDYQDIASAATLGDLVVKPQTAKTYVLQLAKAGYLAIARAAKPGTPAKYRLLLNTGPAAPSITRTKVVFDRNTGDSVCLQTPQEVCDGLE